MRSFSLLLLGVVASAHTEVELEFMQYVSQFGKQYSSVQEYQMRLEMFAKKHAYIQAHDAGLKGYSLGHNHLSDWTDEEYNAIMNVPSYKNHPVREIVSKEVSEDVLKTNFPINWIQNGCVNMVQD